MISVIVGTNRPKSRTKILAEYCFNELSKTSDQTALIDLEKLQKDLFNESMYDENSMSEKLKAVQDKEFIPAKKLLIFLPEYNGGIPGIFKLFLDSLSIRKYKETFRGKKVVLVGLASGRGGNLRGLEYMTGCLNYLGIHVNPEKFCISQIDKLITEGEMNATLTNQLDEIIQSLKQY